MPVSYSTHTVASTASGSALQFAVNYPYILRSHVKVYYGKDILAGTHTSLLVDGADYNWTTDTQITLTAAPSTQSTLTIIRETPTSAQLVPWQDGSNLIAEDLNKSDKQNLYAVQEQDDKTALASSKALSAETTANTATTTANNATATANSATTDAATAISTANTANTNATAAQVAATSAQSSAAAAQASAASAQTSATNAQTDASAAQTAATNAQTSATAAQTSAASAQTSATAAAADAATAISTANTASTNATTALNNSRQSDGQGGFTTAISLANTANTTANSTISTASTASTNASNAVTTANAANATANAAAAAVANAAFYSPIAALANLPSSPADQDRVEVVNSTGVESSSAVSGVPSGFVGSTNLTVRLQYSSSSTKWEWQQYFAADPENRYATNYLPVIKGDGTLSGQVGKITLNCSNNNHGVSLSSPPHSANATYNLTLPTGLPSTTGQALISDTNGNLSFADPAPPDLSITSAKLAAGSATSAKLAEGSVTHSKLATGSVTSSKLANDITIAGNLTVNGTTTTVNSTTLTVDDKNIELGSVSTPSDTTADGGGITIKGATDKTLTWENSTSSWTFNQPVVISPGGTEALRFSTLGQVGIAGANYGTAGQVLMSGGASAAPTWGDVSSSPTFQATAEGSIADNKPVVITPTGTVKEISSTTSTAPAIRSAIVANKSNVSTPLDMAYDSNNNKWAFVFSEDSTENLMITICTVGADGSFTFGTPATVRSGGLTQGASVAYDPNKDLFIVCYRDTWAANYYGTAKACSYTASNDTWTFGSATVFQSIFVTKTQVLYHPVSGNFVLATALGSSGNYIIKIFILGVNASTLQVSSVNSRNMTTNLTYHEVLTLNPVDNIFLLTFCGTYNFGTNGALMGESFRVNSSSSIISVNGQTYNNPSPEANHTERQSVVYDPDYNDFVVTYITDNNTAKYGIIEATANSNTATVIDQQILSATSNGRNEPKLAYDEFEDEFVFTFRDVSVGNLAYVRGERTSSTSITWSNSSTYVDSVTPITSDYDASYVGGYYDPVRQQTMFIAAKNSVAMPPMVVSIDLISLTSTINDGVFIGFADGSYTNGQTATIKIVGSVQDNLTGLTPGTEYYVQGDGTLGTSPSPFASYSAGLAVASDKLIIRH